MNRRVPCALPARASSRDPWPAPSLISPRIPFIMLACMSFSDPVRETELVIAFRAPAPGQNRENPRRRAAWVHFILRALTLLLLASTMSLSSQAKNSRYVSPHSPARHLSKISKMRETPIQQVCQVPSGSNDPPPDIAEAESSAPPDVAVSSPVASPVLSADQFRSPPARLL